MKNRKAHQGISVTCYLCLNVTMMVMGDGPPKERGRHRSKVENDMIRRRERDFKYQQMWNGAEDYYKRWEKINTKYDDWTSPRYYEDNNKLISDTRKKREKEELLQKRRAKLKKLLEEEENTYQIELMVRNNLKINEKQFKSKTDDIPTEILKDVDHELKRREEEKRKREAEIKLYHQWRINNPIVRQFESKYRFKDLKLSWLDQQIEKRMQKENEEKANRKYIKEQEERLKMERERDEKLRKKTEEKRHRLKENLEKQMEELKEKQKISEELRKKEEYEMKYKLEIQALEENAKEEEKRRLAKECALFNIKQHKQKLKQKALDIQENLAREKELILKIRKLELQDIIQDERKKKEIKDGLVEFLAIVREQQQLEKQRERQLGFLFDSEAKAVYDKQLEMWRSEEAARKRLLKDVLDTVGKQIEENLQANKDKQKEILKEREELMLKVEQYDRELQALKEQEIERKQQRKKVLEDDIKLKNARKKQEEVSKLKEIDEELERVRREEERLHKEILEIQKRQGPVRRQGRNRIIY